MNKTSKVMKTKIKKFKILVLLMVSATVLTACSSDDDGGNPEPEPTAAELLANKWYLVQQEVTSTTPPTVMVADACQQNTYFNFLNDGNLYAETFGLDIDSNCVSQEVVSATYELTEDGGQIYLTNGEPPITQMVTIESLTETELILTLSTSRITFER